MRYKNVCLEAVSYTLPDEVLTSDEIERRLAPLYQRLRLPEGRLELMTGIRERRLWPAGTLPSEISAKTGRKALQQAGIDPRQVGALIHASVCRDYLEPATACGVHHALGLSPDAVIYDVSNACLGVMNGMLQVANMIELGQIQAGLVVGTESSRPLVEHTIGWLNKAETLTRDDVKLAVASLTIGSGSAAVLLVDRKLSRTGNRITSAIARANTRYNQLCHSGRDEAIAEGMQPLMQTDAETLMREGIALGKETFEMFLDETGWSRDEINATVCHQVGMSHRKLMLAALGLDAEKDFTTVETLGNTGSVALPMTLARAAEAGHLETNDHVGLLGIGSGINVLMMGVAWQTAPTQSLRTDRAEEKTVAPAIFNRATTAR